jgi:hypothetical protein
MNSMPKPPIPMASQQEGPSEEERQQVMRRAREFCDKMILASVEYSTAEALLSAEMFIAFRTAGAKMPLQEVMDNLLSNMPNMYSIAVQITEKEGG